MPDEGRASGVEALFDGFGKWTFKDQTNQAPLAWASPACGGPEAAEPEGFRLAFQVEASSATSCGGDIVGVVREVLAGEVPRRLLARLATPQGPPCRHCAGHGRPRAEKAEKAEKVDKSVEYDARLEELGRRRESAPRSLVGMVGRMLEKLQRLTEKESPGLLLPPALLAERTMRIGTMCSGTDAPVIVAKALERTLRQHGSKVGFEHAFSVEFDAKKQEFLRANFPDCGLLFADVTHMGRQRNFDVLSGKPQPIPGDLDLLVAGFSCKDLSMMNNNNQ